MEKQVLKNIIIGLILCIGLVFFVGSGKSIMTLLTATPNKENTRNNIITLHRINNLYQSNSDCNIINDNNRDCIVQEKGNICNNIHSLNIKEGEEKQENEVLQGYPQLVKVSSFSTNFSSSSQERMTNIGVCANNFAWRIVKKDELISFNNIVGERSIENGYKQSKVILNGKYVDGIGGGVCQVSSTLFNCWVRAGLGIGYVQAHTIPTSYCELSQDATVSSMIDMTLKNTSQSDIIVNGYTKDKNLIFDIYALPSKNKYNIITRVVKELPPTQQDVEWTEKLPSSDSIHYDGESRYIIMDKGRTGFHSRAFLQVISNGKIVQERMIREDIYPPSKIKVLAEKQVV